MGEYMNRNRYRKEKSGIPAFKVKEADVLRSVDQALSLHKIFHYRNNSGGFKTDSGGFVRAGYTGSSDFIGICPDGRFLAVECKRPEGGVLSAAQREFLDTINRNGGVGIVVTSVESLISQLKEAEVI
jgi:hypothetical protein